MSGIIFPRSSARLASEEAFTRFDILASEATIAEFREVILREKFDRYIPVSQRLPIAESFIRFMTVTPVSEQFAVCRDPKDDKILELAVSGNAGLIITGDRDLLALHPFQGIPILSPIDFLLSIADGMEQ